MPSTSATITMNSLTLAMKAKQLLASYSILSDIVRLDPSFAQKGCAYGLSVSREQSKNVPRLLKENGIPYSRVL